MIAAALCWSTGGAFVRALDHPAPWGVVFWRSVWMAVAVAVVLAATGRLRGLRPPDRRGFAAAACLAGTFFFFLLAITRTSTAETLAVMASAPAVAALIGWGALREVIPWRTRWASLAAMIGVGIVAGGALGAGRLDGALLAFGVPVCFAAYVAVTRSAPAADGREPIGAVFWAGVIAMVVSAPLAWPVTAISAHDLGLLAAMGAVQLGGGCMLMTLAARRLPTAEVGLLSLLEPILSPVWTWLIFAEQPPAAALLGGGIVVAALIADEGFRLLAARRANAHY